MWTVGHLRISVENEWKTCGLMEVKVLAFGYYYSGYQKSFRIHVTVLNFEFVAYWLKPAATKNTTLPGPK
jgi:hypothetical protein